MSQYKMLDVESKMDISHGCKHSKTLYFRVRPTGRPLMMKIGCHSRYDCMCPVCAEQWRLAARKRYFKIVSQFKEIRFLTLTLRKDKPGELGRTAQLKQLWEFRKKLFRRLRDDGYYIGNWVATVELPNHIHVIMDSDFIPQKLIKEHWHDITGDSFIVDIRDRRKRTDDIRAAAAYITKYTTKLTKIPYDIMLELKGFHLICTSTHFSPRVRHSPLLERSIYERIDRLTFIGLYPDYYYYDFEAWAEPPSPGTLDYYLER